MATNATGGVTSGDDDGATNSMDILWVKNEHPHIYLCNYFYLYNYLLQMLKGRTWCFFIFWLVLFLVLLLSITASVVVLNSKMIVTFKRFLLL
jgi:hypothetical protein